MSYIPHKSTQEALAAVEDLTDGDGTELTFTSATMKGHMIPDYTNVYDIGSAEAKIRDIYVADGSIWIGDNHKVEVADGKLKFRKRRANQHPAGLDRLMDLFIVELSPGPETSADAERVTVHLVAKSGGLHERTFVKDEEGWKLDHTSF